MSLSHLGIMLGEFDLRKDLEELDTIYHVYCSTNNSGIHMWIIDVDSSEPVEPVDLVVGINPFPDGCFHSILSHKCRIIEGNVVYYNKWDFGVRTPLQNNRKLI